ncbi:MAG: 2-oxoacid:acceptor oxidoreductase family protein [Deltaproteobacteria bacterium]|nr:2-oxoacid:acceptor oxidoreductase family protein [Deltaproteobacteria bacterium]
MIEVRFHGRGGQGAVTSAELMALAAIEEGKFAQAFPSFGPERRGAPVTAYLRVDEQPIRLREKIYEPNIVVVLDPTVMNITKVDEGLHNDGMLIINTNRDAADIRTEYGFAQKLALVDATGIATETLGLPITNTVMLGALIKATGLIDPKAINGPLARRFGSIAPKNQKAYERAFSETRLEE